MSIDRLRAHPVLRYVLVVVAAGATIAVLIPLRFLIEPLPAPPFLLMIMLVAWLAGFGPAIASVVISAVALDYWFIPPLGAVISTVHEAASVVSFITVGAAVAWLTATRRQVEDDRQALLVRERAARASAEAANRAKDEFVAMLGHEFRNPLSAIVNAVQILERVGAQDDTTRHAHEVIARQAKNITRMVEDLLEINRIATGKIRLDLQRLELADMVRHCLATLAGRTAAHRVLFDAADVWVDADPVRLEQIVVNLLDNAVKYTPAGGTIHARVSREGAHAVLRVRDTGVGIAPEVLPRIFDLFVQGEPGASHGRRGLGIGLAVVQRLADLHGGTIEAASDGPGRGSTFSLRLRSVAPPAVRMARGRPALAPAPRRRIVLAESDPDLRAILRSLLETSGHDVSDAADGPEAFATAVRTRPDVMLIDVELAGFDGYELARRLRMAPETKATRLIALIGWERADDIDRARAAGFDQHATKSLDGDALAEILGG
jgi:signal transduction histidine kinase